MALESSKGFYFSFDAFLALLVMVGSLTVVAQSSDINSGSFKSSTVSFREAQLVGKDAMSLASRDTFKVYNESFRDDLVDKTVMEESDLNRTIIDGIGLLWAARNFSYAESAVEKYFGPRVPEGYDYRLQVNEDGSERIIYETAAIPSNAESVSSVSRLVSGHEIDRPSEGFQARARVTESEENQTKVVNIPMMGSGGENLKLFLSKKFQLNASEIHNATLYFAAHWGQSNFNSNTVEVNGNEVDVGGSSDSDWRYIVEKNSTHIGYDVADVTDEVQDGWNEFYLEFKNQNNHHVHIHPGTRIRVRYSTDSGISSGGDIHYLTDVEGEGQNQNKKGGAWITRSFYLPDNSTVHNASLRLNLRNVKDEDGRNDLEVYIDEERVYQENLSGDVTRNLNLTGDFADGNNVLSVYVNTHVSDGEITGFGGFPGNPRIYSDPENDAGASSRLLLDSSSPESGLEFGKIEVRTSENLGGEASNPKTSNVDIDDGTVVRDAFLNLAQLDSRNVTVEAGSDSLHHVFTSPREFATPTRIGIDTSLLESGETSEIRVEDECSIDCSVLPESSLEKHIMVPSQVGYGDLFENESFAVDDARDRLKDQLGEYIRAEQIETGTVSTGNQPYLWGPASVKLVVWK